MKSPGRAHMLYAPPLTHIRGAHSSPFRAHVAGRACGAALRARARALRTKAQGESFQRVPLVDLSRLGGPNEAELVEELRDICHNVGFFYASAHGVPEELLQRTLAVTEAFFAMPMEAKLNLDNGNSPAFRGYIVQGTENTAGLPDEREQVEFGVETDAMPAAQPEAPVYMRLRGPNQWPAEEQCPHFRSTMLEYMGQMDALSRRLMRLLATSLLLPPTHFDDTFGSQPNVQMKIARYPPLPKAEDVGRGVGTFGVGPHSDSGFLSLLLQDDVGGLEVLNSDGEWVAAPPVPNTFVVNLGEMLQLATGGYYVATVHRVVNADTTCARLSVPYFFNPQLSAQITAVASPLPPWDRPRAAADATATHAGANRLLPVYGDNAFKSLARSHPRVTKRHHGDLVLQDGKFVMAPPRAHIGDDCAS